MDIPGFVDDVRVQVIAAGTILFIVFCVIFIKNRSFMLFVGFGLLFGAVVYGINNPEIFEKIAGWGIEGVTK